MEKFKLTIFDKYIFKQVLGATLVCLLLFIIVWIAPETLVRIIKRLLIEHISIFEALKMLAFEIPKVLAKAIPVGIMLGSLFTFDSLCKNSELSIFRGVGLSFTRIMAPVLVFGAFLSLLCFYVNDQLIPLASARSGEGLDHNAHFVYMIKNPDESPKQAVIVSNFTRLGIANLIVLNFSEKNYDDVSTFKSIIFSPFAIKTVNNWTLREAKRYVINKNGIYTHVEDIGNYKILKEEGQAEEVYGLMKNSTRRDRSFTTLEMYKYIKLLKSQDYTDECNFMLAKFYQRFLHPLTCIIFAAIGCLLGFSPPRSQRLVGFTAGVGIIFAYYITLPFFDMLAQKSVLPPFLASLIPIAIFIATIFIIKKIRDL